LAEQLGVSRTVVREATKRLELQGLLEVQHGVGIRFVEKLYAPVSASVEMVLPETAERLRQLAEARLAIEPGVARMAAERAKAEHFAALRATQDRLASAVETAEAIDADLEFHRILARAAGNRILELVLESLGELGRASRQATLASTGIARAHEHHELILQAIEQRRPQVAHDTMKMHLEGSLSDLARLHAAK
jgi:GntR family transcriptional repressor for pyruvate dehydrogenase complex